MDKSRYGNKKNLRIGEAMVKAHHVGEETCQTLKRNIRQKTKRQEGFSNIQEKQAKEFFCVEEETECKV